MKNYEGNRRNDDRSGPFDRGKQKKKAPRRNEKFKLRWKPQTCKKKRTAEF